MKKLFFIITILFGLVSYVPLHANPLSYIEKCGWKETEKTKEMNVKNFHVYMLNDKAGYPIAGLLYNGIRDGHYMIWVFSVEERLYAVYTTKDVKKFKKALQAISQHQIPDVEWTFIKEDDFKPSF